MKKCSKCKSTNVEERGHSENYYSVTVTWKCKDCGKVMVDTINYRAG